MGITLTTPLATVTVAVPVFVGSCWEVAVMVYVPGIVLL
jgi:hypothetical protein